MYTAKTWFKDFKICSKAMFIYKLLCAQILFYVVVMATNMICVCESYNFTRHLLLRVLDIMIHKVFATCGPTYK